MRSRLPLLTLALLLGSCSTPPKPPTVDESNKRPANSASAVELQVCKSDLRSARIAVSEATRQTEAHAAMVERVLAHHRGVAALPAVQPVNAIYTVHFGFGSTRVTMPNDTEAALVEEARTAPLIVLRGRTDGKADTAHDARIARERAIAVRDHLAAAGVDPARIRVTYQASGDHIADNTTSAGRAANRRVEVELYRAAPIATTAHAITPQQAHATQHAKE